MRPECGPGHNEYAVCAEKLPEIRNQVCPPCRIIAWEVTRRCNLTCGHCRASAQNLPYSRELSRSEAHELIKDFSSLGNPLIIFTGGEPLLRPDLFELIAAVREHGLKTALSSNGTLISSETTAKIKSAGVSCCAISIDGGCPAAHDAFRGVAGAFEQAVRGAEMLVQHEIPVQLNTTVTKSNLGELPAILSLCKQLGATAWHIFLLVPVGRGAGLQGLGSAEYESALRWVYEQSLKNRAGGLEIRPTCAPQYNRLLMQRAECESLRAACVFAGGKQTQGPCGNDPRIGHGCLGGTGFCFVSHTGIVQPCGYLELNCGDARKQSMLEIWRSSPVFSQLRNLSSYAGKCGTCRFYNYCGGCRARAYEAHGNYLADDPVCAGYFPF